MKTKFIYESPVVEVLEIAAEGVLCTSQVNQKSLGVEKWSYDQNFSW